MNAQSKLNYSSINDNLLNRKQVVGITVIDCVFTYVNLLFSDILKIDSVEAKLT